MRRSTCLAMTINVCLIVGCVCAQDASLEFKSGAAGDIVAEMKPEAGLDMGETRTGVKIERKIAFKNSLKRDLLFGPMRSPCPCIDIEGAPEILKSGESATLRILLDGEGYIGEFAKFTHVRLIAGKIEKDIFLPVRFTVLGNDGETAISQNQTTPEGPVKFIAYKGGGLEAHPKAEAWIFAGRNCPGCNFLKAELLPKLFLKDGAASGTHEAVIVDLDEKESFIFLTALEAKLGAGGDKTPVLYYGGRLIHGNDAVKELIEASVEKK